MTRPNDFDEKNMTNYFESTKEIYGLLTLDNIIPNANIKQAKKMNTLRKKINKMLLTGLLVTVCLLSSTPTHAQITNTSVDSTGGIPTLLLNGSPYYLNGWTVGLNLSNQTNEQVKATMDSVKTQGFEVVEIFIEWKLVELSPDVFDFARIDSLMDYAQQLGLYVLLQPEVAKAPWWFADNLYPNAIFSTYDPDSASHSGYLWGPLTISGFGSLPIFYHPDYIAEADTFYTKVINRYKNHPVLFGWTLFVFTSGEYNYPGGLTYGISGFTDYSNYTKTLYGSEPPKPLNLFSQPSPDTRPEWQNWRIFLRDKKRWTLDHFSQLIKTLDPNHVLIAYPGISPLWGEFDNGLVAESSVSDYTYVLKNPNIDIIRVAPQISQDFMEVVNTEMSFVTYILEPYAESSFRYGKAFLLQTERQVNSASPSVTGKITAWTEWAKSLGMNILWWSDPDTASGVSGIWTQAEKQEIAQTLQLNNLPLIERYTISDFAFIDLTGETGKYYAENGYSLIFAMKQLKGFIDASLPYDVLSEEEIISNPLLLSNYKAIGFPLPCMYNQLASDTLKSLISSYQTNGGRIWWGDSLDGYNYYNSGYTDNIFLDSLRSFYNQNGLLKHSYNGYRIYVFGNKPYIFIFSRELNFSGIMKINVKGWNLSDGSANFIEFNSGQNYTAQIVGDTAIFNVNLIAQNPYLFVLDSLTGISESTFSYEIQVYPNPTGGNVTIDMGSNFKEKVLIRITNIDGQEVLRKQNTGKQLITMNMDGLPTGMYFIHVQSENNLTVYKLIVIE